MLIVVRTSRSRVALDFGAIARRTKESNSIGVDCATHLRNLPVDSLKRYLVVFYPNSRLLIGFNSKGNCGSGSSIFLIIAS